MDSSRGVSSPEAAAENQLLYWPHPPDQPGAGLLPGMSKFPRRAGTPPCSPWCRFPAPGRRWPSWATRSPRRPPPRPLIAPNLIPRFSWTTRSAVVWIDGREIPLTFQEFELLAFLAAHPGTVFTRAELVERVWHRALAQDGRPVARDSRTVDVHVSRLRRKLGPRHGQCLVTEYRVGYRYLPRPA